MNLRSRIAALVKRHQAGMVERISRMGGEERVALVRRMFAGRAEQAGPEHGLLAHQANRLLISQFRPNE